MTENEKDDQFINTYMITNDDEQSSTTVKTSICPHIKWIPFIFGILFFLIGLINMIVFYAIPQSIINKNKHQLPDAEFDQINFVLVIIHFIFHSFVIIFSISLLLFSLRGFFVRHTSIIIIFLVITSSLTFIFWVTYACLVFTSTHDPESKISISHILSLMNNDSPSELAFIYSKDTERYRDCIRNPNTGSLVCTDRYLTCYSDSGISIPLKSRLMSDPLDLSKAPDIFYFKINQIINKSENFSIVFNSIMDKIEECNYWDKAVDYYPIIDEIYIVSTKDAPSSLTHRTRLLTTIFGVGIYYEMYTKSIPYITYNMKIYTDINPNVDYSKIWTPRSCEEYGQCDPLNHKPTP